MSAAVADDGSVLATQDLSAYDLAARASLADLLKLAGIRLDPEVINGLTVEHRAVLFAGPGGVPVVPPPGGFFWTPDYRLLPTSLYNSDVTSLLEGEWRMIYPPSGPYPGGDLTFGSLESGYDLMTSPTLNYGDFTLGDTNLPNEDGVRFGRDYVPGTSLTFEVNVHTASSARMLGDNLDQTGRFLAQWSAPALRHAPGAVAELRTRNGGRLRMVYGRPRKCAPMYNTRKARQGHTALICDFQAVDDNFYDAIEQTHTVTLEQAPVGALAGPLVSPVSMTSATATPSIFQVGGQRPAWTVVTIYGPVSNPVVEIPGQWRVGFNLSLAYDETIQIDTRPWARTVLRNGVRSVAGAMTRDAPRMADMKLAVGTSLMTFRGKDPTGQAKATLAWRDTYAYL